jgi:hypothetical protein
MGDYDVDVYDRGGGGGGGLAPPTQHSTLTTLDKQLFTYCRPAGAPGATRLLMGFGACTRLRIIPATILDKFAGGDVKDWATLLLLLADALLAGGEGEREAEGVKLGARAERDLGAWGGLWIGVRGRGPGEAERAGVEETVYRCTSDGAAAGMKIVYGCVGEEGGAAEEMSASASGAGSVSAKEETKGEEEDSDAEARFACELDVSGITLGGADSAAVGEEDETSGSSPNGSNLYDGGMRMDTDLLLLCGGGGVVADLLAPPAYWRCSAMVSAAPDACCLALSGAGAEWVRSRRWCVYMCVLCELMLWLNPCAAYGCPDAGWWW